MTTRKKGNVRALEYLEKLTGEKPSLSLSLRAYMTREDITQVELAELLGVTKGYVSNIINKRKFVSIHSAAEMANVLGMPVSYFVKLAIQDDLGNYGLDFTVDVYSDEEKKKA